MQKGSENMNKIFKVIWSKTRNCYVVASELAKGRTKAASTGDKAKRLALAAITALMLLPVGGYSYAANISIGTATINDSAGKKTTVFTGNQTAAEAVEAAVEQTVPYNSEQIGILQDAVQSVEEELAQHQSLIDNLGTDKLTLSSDNTLQKETYDSTTKTTTTTNVTGLKVAGPISANSASISGTLSAGGAVNAGSVNSRGNITAVGTIAGQTVTATGTMKGKDLIGSNSIISQGTIAATGNISSQATVGAKEMVSQTNITAKNKVVGIQGVVDNTLTSGNYITAGNTVGENIVALDTQVKANANAINTEATAREKEDARLNSEIVNTNKSLNEAATNLSKLNTAVVDGFKTLKQADENEAVARKAADEALDSRAKALEDKTEAITYDKDSKTVMVDGKLTATEGITDGTMRDGKYVKLDKYVGQNLNALDQGLQAETSARVTADTKLVEATNGGLSLGDGNVLQTNTTTIDAATGEVTTSKTDANEMILNKGKDNQITLNENGIKVGTNSTVVDKDGVYTGGDTYSEAKAALKSDGSIKGADGKFTVNSANGTVNVNDQIELNGATGVVKSNGLNVGDGNMTVSNNGNINTVGTLSVADGNFKVNSSGGVTAAGGKTTLASDGSIKAADGKFTVNSNGGVKAADGKITLSSDGSVKAADGKFTVNSNGAVKAANGNTTIDSNGNLKTAGTLSAADASFKVDSNGKITSTGLDAGNGTIQTTGTVKAGDVQTGTLETTGDATIGGSLTVDKNLTVNGEFNAKTLSSKLDENNYTIINGGKTQSMNLKMNAATGETQASASTFDETGSNMWAKDDDSIGKSTVTADGISQKLSDTGDNPTAYAESTMSQGTDNKYSMTDTVKDRDKTNVASQSATESSNVITDENKNTSTFRQKVDAILQEINNADKTKSSSVEQKLDSINSKVTDGTNTTSMEQGTTDITNKAEQGTISNIAKDLVNTATGNMTNTVGGKMLNDVTGDMENKVGGELKTTVTGKVTEDYKSDLSTKVGGDETHAVTGNQTTTVSGNRTVNVKGTETENFNALETNVKTDQKTSVGGNQTTIVTGNQTNNVSGNKTETVKGSVTEKYGSQATTVDGDQSTNIGGNQTTVVAKNQTNTVSGNKTETVKGAVNETYGSQTTKVNGDQSTTVTGKQTNSITGDQVNTIGGNQTTTVTGDSSLTAENITNTAKNKITNKAIDVETDATSSIVQKIANDYGSNTSTQLSYQTKEEMSQADGKTASYLRGAAEEKSQLIDGSKKTTIDTIAGQTNTNITDGTNTSNDLQKADQVASSVTDGTNTTVVNQDAKSLASSITDGTKANNTNNTVDKSEQLIKASDTQYSATSKTATKMEDALVSGGSVIDVIKNLDDAANPFIGSAVTDGTNSTGVTQTAKDITNTAKNGTIANEAKDITNNATENMTNTVGKDLTTTVGGEMKTTVTGKTTENYNGGLETTITGEEKHTVNGSQTTTVTGDSSLSAKNITNTATEKLSNSATDIENKASTSILNHVGDNTSWKMTDGQVVESIKGADGQTNTTTTTAYDTYQSVQNGNNVLAKRTSSTNDNLNITDGTNTYSKITTATSNKQTVTDGKETASTNLTKSASNTYITNGTQTVTNHIAADTTNTVMNEGSNGSRQEQTASQILDRVTDGTNTNSTTTTASGTTFENTAHNTALTEMTKHESGDFTKTTISGNTIETGQATMDYAEVMKNLGVHGNATVDGNTSVGGTLSVTGTSTLTGDVTMKSNATVENNLTVKGTTTTDKLVVNNGATVTGGTTTDTLHVTSSSTFDGAATFKDVVTMKKDLSVAGSMTASSYKVGDKTYISESGINANNQKVVNVAAGDLSANSTDAVNGAQLYQTNERVTGVENKVNKLDSRVDKVGANAAALANLHPLEFDADSKWNIAAAVGGYKGETATAIGAFYRPNENVMVNVSSSFGTGENMYGGGISLRIGQGGNKARRNATNGLTEREKAMQKQIDSLTSRLDALLSVINPNMSKDFPDVPENHWAYEAVSRLAGNGVIQGYEDGKYHGDRTMTRYEMAEIIYNALSKGAKAEKKLVEEFKPELQAMAAQKKA